MVQEKLTEQEQELLDFFKQHLPQLKLRPEQVKPENLFDRRKDLDVRYEENRLNKEEYEQEKKALVFMQKNLEKYQQAQAKQTRMVLNQQTMQEQAQANQSLVVQDDLGRSVTIQMPTAQDVNQLPRNGIFLMPKLSFSGGSQELAGKVQQISEQVVEQIANQQKIPIKPNSDNAGRLQFFTCPNALGQQQQQKMQKDFEKQFLTLLSQNLKATQTQQAVQQQAQQKGTAPTPFSTTPIKK